MQKHTSTTIDPKAAFQIVFSSSARLVELPEDGKNMELGLAGKGSNHWRIANRESDSHRIREEGASVAIWHEGKKA